MPTAPSTTLTSIAPYSRRAMNGTSDCPRADAWVGSPTSSSQFRDGSDRAQLTALDGSAAIVTASGATPPSAHSGTGAWKQDRDVADEDGEVQDRALPGEPDVYDVDGHAGARSMRVPGARPWARCR